MMNYLETLAKLATMHPKFVALALILIFLLCTGKPIFEYLVKFSKRELIKYFLYWVFCSSGLIFVLGELLALGKVTDIILIIISTTCYIILEYLNITYADMPMGLPENKTRLNKPLTTNKFYMSGNEQAGPSNSRIPRPTGWISSGNNAPPPRINGIRDLMHNPAVAERATTRDLYPRQPVGWMNRIRDLIHDPAVAERATTRDLYPRQNRIRDFMHDPAVAERATTRDLYPEQPAQVEQPIQVEQPAQVEQPIQVRQPIHINRSAQSMRDMRDRIETGTFRRISKLNMAENINYRLYEQAAVSSQDFVQFKNLGHNERYDIAGGFIFRDSEPVYRERSNAGDRHININTELNLQDPQIMRQVNKDIALVLISLNQMGKKGVSYSAFGNIGLSEYLKNVNGNNQGNFNISMNIISKYVERSL